tara:strand:- start:3338 stop:4483 length:1146 start_codon:yes stop_codon:yes gene_type:complete
MSEAPAKPRSKAFKIRVSVLLLLGLIAFSQLGQLNRFAITEGVLQSDSPDPAMLHKLLSDTPEPAILMARIWATGKLPHRWEIINFLNRNLGVRPDLVPIVGKYVLEAANDPDQTLRLTALSLLRVIDHPEWKTLAQAALNDPDPLVNDVARIILKKADADIEVAAIAPTLNQNLGPDFGHLVFRDFKKQPYTLTQYVGRPVLLHFFATWSPDCTKEIPDLVKLRKIAPPELAIVGVNVDAVPGVRHDHGDCETSCETDCNHGPDCEHDHGSDTVANLFKSVERHVIINEYNYPIVFDTNGLATAQLEGSELPLHVLLDGDHRLVRRYAGTRSARVHDRIARALLGFEVTRETTNQPAIKVLQADATTNVQAPRAFTPSNK